jgi:membrane-associated phospholipid phosphatase
MEQRLDYNPTAWRWVIALAVLGLAAIPLDGFIGPPVRNLGQSLGGDLRRELEAWGQYGQGLWVVVVAVAFLRLQPWRWRRLLDLGVAAALTWAATYAIKLVVGRPRPRFDDPAVFLGPFGAYPVSPDAGVRHAWEFWTPISSDLWSMPSSHTAYAAMLSVWIAAIEPRLRWLVLALASVVGASRVLLGAHWVSDVLIGAALGLACATPAVRHAWGVRALDAVWRRLVNPNDPGAWPALLDAETRRRPVTRPHAARTPPPAPGC